MIVKVRLRMKKEKKIVKHSLNRPKDKNMFTHLVAGNEFMKLFPGPYTSLKNCSIDYNRLPFKASKELKDSPFFLKIISQIMNTP